MRIRDSIFIILGLTLLTFVVYLKLELAKLENKNLNLKISERTISQEFKNYKAQEIQKKFLQEKKRAQEKRKRLALEEEQQRVQKIENLKIKVDTAYEAAQKLYTKYKNRKCKKSIIKEALNQHLVFIKDYEGNSVGEIQAKELQTQGRAIGLEEIQKVRRHKEGFIKISPPDAKITQTIYVKDLEMYDLYIGSSTIF
jgi:hypothetical protein